MANLETGWVKNINYFKDIPSTQDYAIGLARSGAEEGTLVVSETQSSGKGRRGSAWVSPKGGLWFSFVLRPETKQMMAPALSLSMGLAVCSGIQRLTGLEISIKWPNDVCIGKKKLAGVIADMETEDGRIRHVVIGVGINTNVKIGDLPHELRESAVSLSSVGCIVDNLALMGFVLEEAGRIYGIFKKTGFSPILLDIKLRCPMLGRTVRATDKSFVKSIQGTAMDITEKGGLLIRTDSGIMMEMFSGSVEIL